MSLHLYWTKKEFLGGVFSVKIENVIFDPSSCNESGTTESQKSDFFDFCKAFEKTDVSEHNSIFRHAKMFLFGQTPKRGLNMEQYEWEQLSPEDKKKQLFLNQKKTLETFLKHGAISKSQFDKSISDLTLKMGMNS